jgi:hypothetical protein
MAEAQRQFSLDVGARIRDRIANAPLPIPTFYRGLVEEADEIDAKRQLKMSKAAALADDIAARVLQLHMAQEEERKLGVEYLSEETEFDAKGGKTTTRKKTGYVEKLKVELKAKKDERNALMEKKARTNWLPIANDALGSNVVNLISFGEPVQWVPREGEQFFVGFKREWAELGTIRNKVKAVWDAHLPLSEGIPNMEAYIDTLASSPPNFGGFIRGSSITDHGGVQIGNPTRRIGFVEKRIGNETVTVDAVALVAWAFKDQLKKVAREHMRATYSDEGAISSTDKAVLIPKLEAELWQQRRVVEAAYRACRAAGIRKLNRPKDTPVEILLDVIPFHKARTMRVVQPAPVPEITSTDDPAPDFEGDEGNDE